MDLPFPINQE